MINWPFRKPKSAHPDDPYKHSLVTLRGRGPRVTIRLAYLGSYLHWFNQKAPKSNATVANWSRTIDRLRTV